jgi:hypothetical protein
MLPSDLTDEQRQAWREWLRSVVADDEDVILLRLGHLIMDKFQDEMEAVARREIHSVFDTVRFTVDLPGIPQEDEEDPTDPCVLPSPAAS